mmetsp:Transcript_30862/g.78022  ORF Transcript_30862/g.78022 Transcript_30862/m.78022 type:complete len:282 (+) Transcript_30862:435-1280(+)
MQAAIRLGDLWMVRETEAWIVAGRVEPRAAVMRRSIHRLNRPGHGVVFDEDQAEVGVQHHLVIGKRPADVGPVPLVLVHGGLLRDPALGHHGDVVVVVEDPAVGRIAPPTVVAGILEPRAADGVHAHQGCGLPFGELHVVDEDALDLGAPLLCVWQMRARARAADRGGAPPLEVRLEIDGLRSGRSQDVHDTLGGDDQEVGQRDPVAIPLVDVGKRDDEAPIRLPAEEALREASVVGRLHVRASVRTASAILVVHEVMAGHSQGAAGKLSARTCSGVACLW